MHKQVLVLLTLALDPAHPALGHQIEVANQLANRFKKTVVLTHSMENIQQIQKFNAYSTKRAGVGKIHLLINLIRNIRKISLELSEEEIIVFSHMNPIYSVFWIIFGKKPQSHWLWYAHKSKNIWLKILRHQITGFITSTHGSFPEIKSQPMVIGQGIDARLFPNKQSNFAHPVNFLHIGRIDPSKNILKIIECVAGFLKESPNSKLVFFGKTSPKYADYERIIQDSVKNLGIVQQVEFGKLLKRKEISKEIPANAIFVHSFDGSLDKAILEANLMEIPVATTNIEYLSEFGSWSGLSPYQVELINEINSIIMKPRHELRLELKRRREETQKNHSFENWIGKIEAILVSQ